MRRNDGQGTLIVGCLFIAACVFMCILKFQGCAPNYSTGTRAGTINKLSRKGIVFVSWEGSMMLGGMKAGQNGGMANVWDFSTTDDALAAKLQAAMDAGEPVEVAYNQWLVGPWRLSTPHEARNVK